MLHLYYGCESIVGAQQHRCIPTPDSSEAAAPLPPTPESFTGDAESFTGDAESFTGVASSFTEVAESFTEVA